MNKKYTFLCKQGQEDQVCRLLTKFVAKPSVEPYNGDRGVGIMVSLDVPKGMSKRKIDQLLYSHAVPGSRSRKNRYLVVKLDWNDTYKILDKVGLNEPFIRVTDGKMEKTELRYISYGCECCGGYYEFSPV